VLDVSCSFCGKLTTVHLTPELLLLVTLAMTFTQTPFLQRASNFGVAHREAIATRTAAQLHELPRCPRICCVPHSGRPVDISFSHLRVSEAGQVAFPGTTITPAS
jgi:hypothetical protein